jgi:hypothetical protein
LDGLARQVTSWRLYVDQPTSSAALLMSDEDAVERLGQLAPGTRLGSLRLFRRIALFNRWLPRRKSRCRTTSPLEDSIVAVRPWLANDQRLGTG